MSSFETDRNLLVGILGLQMGFITEPQLISAMQAWIFRKSEKIEDLLLEQKALQLDMHDFLVGMADRHIAVHANDPSKSLAALWGPLGTPHMFWGVVANGIGNFYSGVVSNFLGSVMRRSKSWRDWLVLKFLSRRKSLPYTSSEKWSALADRVLSQ